jgi:hypothetical protein
MKTLSELILTLFISSVAGIIIFPSFAMVACSTQTAMCHNIMHQIDKALDFFIGIFLTGIYFLALLIVFLIIYLFLKDNKINLYLKRKVISFSNIYFDYLKILFSRGIIKGEIYY